MRKKLLLLLSCISIIAFPIYSFALAEPPESESESTPEAESTPIDGFRDFKWGTSFADVKDAVITNDMVYDVDYATAYYDDGSSAILVIDGSVSTFKAMVYYSFQDSSLVTGMYRLQENHTNSNSYYDDYCKLVDLYTEIYGDPYGSQEDWSNDLYKDDKSRIGTALSYGYVTIRTFWRDDDGNRIVLTISGDNFEITTDINYYSFEFESSSNTDGI